jgi:DNA repair protein RadC
MNYATALINLPLVCEAKGGKIDTPEAVAAVCCDLSGLAQESLHVLTLNTKNVMINRHLVGLGSVSSAPVTAREAFRSAICEGAASVVIVHNHPSGDPTPSREDIEATRSLIEAGRIVGIPVFDHVIMGRDAEGNAAHLSLRERNLCTFNYLITK